MAKTDAGEGDTNFMVSVFMSCSSCVGDCRLHAINPFTATACKTSGLKGARTYLQDSTFSGPITNLFSILCVLTQILSCQCEETNKKT